MPFFYFDPTYSLVIIGVLICMAASARVKSTYAKYSRMRSHTGMTGREAAERVLRGAGIYDVRVEHIRGNLTDNYDPRNKVLHLSDTTYNSASVAAIGVAAHECGHAIQHARGYAPIKLRSAIVPVANFGSAIAWPLILFGLLFHSESSAMLINLGISEDRVEAWCEGMDENKLEPYVLKFENLGLLTSVHYGNRVKYSLNMNTLMSV